MGKFLEEEKKRYLEIKKNSDLFSVEAQADGIYKGKTHPFCLPIEYAEENLFPGIRDQVMEYFQAEEIKWHDGREGKPSNHLCDSQVCCVNFLFPFAYYPQVLIELIKPLFPSAKRMLPLEAGNQFISMEWIGNQNYLGEREPKSGKRTRGANITSADAAIRFENQDGQKQIVLIEWKYTESYSSTFLKYSKSGTDRTEIYKHLYLRDDFPLDKERLPDFNALFYEPFYQLFRQQLLANEMEKANEFGADIVSLLHIAPAANLEFQRVTSPELRPLGETVIDVWNTLVRKSNRFHSTSADNFFGLFPISRYPEMEDWFRYITSRYSWF